MPRHHDDNGINISDRVLSNPPSSLFAGDNTRIGVSSITSDTVLLLHMNGADASTSFPDTGCTVHTATVNGNAQIDTAQSKFGGASGLFDGTGDFLTFPDSADWEFNENDFTIDLWVRFSSIAFTQPFLCYDKQFCGGGNINWCFSWNQATAELSFDKFDDPGPTISKAVSWSPSINIFYHVTVSREGNNLRFFIDGTQQGATQDVTGVSYNKIAGATLFIGHFTDGAGCATSEFANGHMDEIRIVKGRSDLVSTFTAPARPYADCGSGSNEYTLSKVHMNNLNSAMFALDAGTADAYAWNADPAPTAYAAGMRFDIKITNTNTGASTGNANSLGVKNIKVVDGTDPVAGAILSGMIAEFEFDGTNLILKNPATHTLGGAEHAADTLANLNAKVSDATLVDTGDARFSDARTPTAHALGGAEHSADTKANVDGKISDGEVWPGTVDKVDSGSTSVTADVDTVLSTFLITTGKCPAAYVSLTDDVVFTIHQDDTAAAPATDVAHFAFKKTATADQFTLNIRQKDGGSAARNFDWIILAYG